MIDLRTLMPYDWETIARAVKETNRVVVAHEDQLTCGFGAELAARIGEELFLHLDAPVTPRRRARHAGGLRARPRGSDPAAVVRRPRRDPQGEALLVRLDVAHRLQPVGL